MDGFGGPGKAMRIAEMGSIGGRDGGPGPSLTRTFSGWLLGNFVC